MDRQIPLGDDALAPDLGIRDDDPTHEVAPDVAYRRLGIVNVVFLGSPGAGDRGWVLVDAGLPGTRGVIERAAAARFGQGARPAAIVLTHGHFDHVGVLRDLAEGWDAPVIAHRAERPHLDGTLSYPKPDPSVGGLMALLSPLYPRAPVDVTARLHLVDDGEDLLHLPGWRAIHTPGHTEGHMSLWRQADRTVIAGDAFITTRQESAYAVAVQEAELHGPPSYFTPDWPSARHSVERLAGLEPELAVTGHGRPMHGPALREALHTLARDFDRIAVPHKR